MMAKDVNVKENTGYSTDTKVKRVYWGAILAGAIVMLIAMMLLNLLGFGIGIGSIDPTTETNPFQGLGTGTLIWWIISNILAIFAGGYVAGRMAGIPHKQSGILHGILAWCIFTFITLWIYTTAVGTIVSGVGSVISGTFSGLNQVVNVADGSGKSDIAKSINLSEIKTEINQALRELEVRDTVRQLRKDFRMSEGDIMAIFRSIYIEDGNINTEVSRAEIKQAVVQETNLSEEQANRIANILERHAKNIKQEWKTIKQKATRTGEDIASAVSKAAIWSFIALLVGVITAAIGGFAGKPAHFLHEEIFR